MTKRIAQCACGRIRVDVENEPLQVVACHCDFCQKRTGTVVQVCAYFIEDDGVEIRGETKVYNGVEIDGVAAITGDEISYNPCSTCGSTVFWRFEGRRPLMGIAVGNFVDPEFRHPRWSCTRLCVIAGCSRCLLQSSSKPFRLNRPRFAFAIVLPLLREYGALRPKPIFELRPRRGNDAHSPSRPHQTSQPSARSNRVALLPAGCRHGRRRTLHLRHRGDLRCHRSGQTQRRTTSQCGTERLRLAHANLAEADLEGANLTNASLEDAALSGANLDGVTWEDTTCPDGTNSDNDGETCANNLG
jgi:hypothetical protein